MELDEFKSYWNNIHEKEIEKQKLTTETLDKIIMKTISTLSEIQQKNAFWSKLGAGACGALIAVLLINFAMAYFVPNHFKTFGKSIVPILIMVIFAIVTMLFYKWQERIFDVNTDENLKEVLEKMLADFKRFYIILNVVYLFLYPVYFYAAIQLLQHSLKLQTNTVLWICGVLTIVSLVLGHMYYKLKYFKRIKALEDNLKELCN